MPVEPAEPVGHDIGGQDADAALVARAQPLRNRAVKVAARKAQFIGQFLGAGVEVYEGMVVGENTRPVDIPINVCKKKHLTNMRSSNKDIEVRLTPPRQMSLDEAIEYLADDELLEVTPQNFRIRKKILSTDERGKVTKRAAKELLGEE